MSAMSYQYIFVCLISLGIAQETIVLVPVTVVANGAFVSQVKGVLLFSDTEIILEPLIDLPSVKFSPNESCYKCDIVVTNITSANLHAIQSTYDVISALSEVFSFKGLSYSKFETVHELYKSRYGRVIDDADTVPVEEEVSELGPGIYKSIVDRLQVLESSVTRTSTSRQERSPLSVVGIGYPALAKLGSKLFLPKNGILKLLLNLAKLKPDSLLNFASSPKFASKLTSVSIEAMKKIFLAQENVQLIENKWKVIQDKTDIASNVYSSGQSLARQIASLIEKLQQLLSSHIETNKQVGYNTFLTNLLTQELLHYNALQSCRDGTIPPTFLPPSLLKKRLAELVDHLPMDIELGVSMNDIQRLYTYKNTRCFFDADGGVMEVTIPTKRKDEEFSLYHVQSLYFAWHNKTCSISVESGYVAVETNTRSAFPIRREAGNICQPQTDFTCLINMASTGGWEEDVCVRTMLGGGTSEEVEKSCRLKCVDSVRIITSQLDETTFVVAHVPKTGTVIDCPGFPLKYVSHNFDTGSFRFFLAPNCFIRIHGKIVARATRKQGIHADTPVSVQHLIPSHWTHLQDWVAFDYNSSPEISFKNITPVLNLQWKEGPAFPFQLPTPGISTIITTVWNSVHTAIILYLLYKVHWIPLVLLQDIPRTEAHPFQSCQSNEDLFVYLYVIVGLLLSIVCPKVVLTILSQLKLIWHFTVQREAVRKLETAV